MKSRTRDCLESSRLLSIHSEFIQGTGHVKLMRAAHVNFKMSNPRRTMTTKEENRLNGKRWRTSEGCSPSKEWLPWPSFSGLLLRFLSRVSPFPRFNPEGEEEQRPETRPGARNEERNASSRTRTAGTRVPKVEEIGGRHDFKVISRRPLASPC